MQFASWASEKAAAESLKVAGKSKIMQKMYFTVNPKSSNVAMQMWKFLVAIFNYEKVEFWVTKFDGNF